MRFRVCNPELLSSLLRTGVRERFGGNLSRAARDTGLVSSHLRKLMRPPVNWITVETKLRLERLVAPRHRDDLDRALQQEAVTPVRFRGPAASGVEAMAVNILRVFLALEFETFERWADAEGIGGDIVTASMRRMVRPLIELDIHGRTVLRLERMTQDELRLFVQAGLLTERLRLHESENLAPVDTGHAMAG